jgi:3-methyl-2-oxobutanoate hydroxymethyltransferase
MRKITTTKLLDMKREGEKISMLTCYDYSMALILDKAGVDVIFVGDSLGVVVLGYENTLPVTIDEILHHTKAVKRGVKNALLIADMPFLSYQVDTRDAILHAGRLIKEGGAEGVKLEGGEEITSIVSTLVKIEIPVMGHIGLTPQGIHKFGGYKIQGRTRESREKIKRDAKALEEAGAFAIVLECIPSDLAREITSSIRIPTIGIGAGPDCDGQVLVVNDMLGLYEHENQPKFIKKYANLKESISDAVKKYISDIRSGKFPTLEQSYK